MKKYVTLSVLLIMTIIGAQQSVKANHVIICREKIGGDKTNKFNEIKRDESTSGGITTIDIHCANPGSNSCPTASPRLPDDPEDVGETTLGIDLVNATETIFTFIETQFTNGINYGSNGYTLQVTQADGTVKSYYISYNWELTSNNTEKAIIDILEL